MIKKNNILITGAAGFIGFHLSQELLSQGNNVVGVDNLNDYYDVALKYTRLELLEKYSNFTFIKSDISSKNDITDIFELYQPTVVINLAAQAGVRYSIDNPDSYIKSNIIGFFNILEACRFNNVSHLIYASSSSVYGNNKKVPFEESDFVDNPASLYAATKKSNELMASTYSHLYNIPITGLRFFTVYGPLGRPDMAYFSFVNKYFNDEAIKIFNNEDFTNDLYRDFTYIEDIILGITKVIPKVPEKTDDCPAHRVLNIGNNKPIKLMDFIYALEKALSNSLSSDIHFKKIYEPIKPGDVPATYASIEKLYQLTGFKPKTDIEKGLQKFTDWYVDYFSIK